MLDHNISTNFRRIGLDFIILVNTWCTFVQIQNQTNHLVFLKWLAALANLTSSTTVKLNYHIKQQKLKALIIKLKNSQIK